VVHIVHSTTISEENKIISINSLESKKCNQLEKMETDSLVNTEFFVNKESNYYGWPKTTDKLDGDFLKEYESTIERVNKTNQKFFLFYVIFLIFSFLLALSFSLLSLIVLIPLFIIYFSVMSKVLSSAACQDSNLLEMKMNYGFCSDYVTVKKKVQSV
jgi:hypothetical protein